MSTATAMRDREYELESEFEMEGEFEDEYEGEYETEGEAEAEEFFRRVASLARRAAQSPTLRRVGLAAARSALGSLGNVGGAIGGAPGSRGATVGANVGSALGNVLGTLLPQREGEFEDEYEFESEDEGEGEINPLGRVFPGLRGPGPANPIRRVYPGALMEHLGHAAAEAENEAEAEAFIGALIPVAARALPRATPAILRAAPQLARGVTQVARTLRANPATRPLVRTLPTIVRQTATNLAQQAAQGRPVTPRSAVRTLAQQTARVISSPQQSARAYQRSRALDRQYHRVAGRMGAAGMPGMPPGRPGAPRAGAAPRRQGLPGQPSAACPCCGNRIR
jgi:hypothetical protein